MTSTKAKKKRKGESAAKRNGQATVKAVDPLNWAEWTIHLAERRSPKTVEKVLPGGVKKALRWSLPNQFSEPESVDLINQIASVFSNKSKTKSQIAGCVEQWAAEADSRPVDAVFAVETVAWSYSLDELAQVLMAGPWYELLKRLISISEQAALLRAEERPLVHQLLTGELPLVLAYRFPEIDECRALLDGAIDSISQAMVELLDGEGLPHSRHLAQSRPLLGCWTRCRYLLDRGLKVKISKDSRNQYDWLIQQGLRLCRRDGRQVLTTGPTGASADRLISAILDLSDDPDDSAIAACVLDDRKTTKKVNRDSLPEPTIYSEWSGLGVFRTDWSKDAAQMAVAFGGTDYQLELNKGDTSFLSGDVTPQLSVGGTALKPISDWEEVCRFSDNDGDLLETELSLENGWRIERQVYLTRKDSLAYLADAVIGPETAESKQPAIEYEMTLPIDKDLRVQEADETRELLLCRKSKGVAMLLPLAQSEWSAAPSPASLTSANDGLRHRVATNAARLYVPLLIDMDRRRIKKPLTWRQLTVAQKLEIQDEQTAVGYRVEVGPQQFLIYRSLASRENRSLLGQNVICEFLFGRFGRDGEVTELVEIE